MHGSPWLRASEATRVRRRQNVEVGRLGDGGLGDGGIFIGVFSDVRILNELLRLQHDLAHNPLVFRTIVDTMRPTLWAYGY